VVNRRRPLDDDIIGGCSVPALTDDHPSNEYFLLRAILGLSTCRSAPPDASTPADATSDGR